MRKNLNFSLTVGNKYATIDNLYKFDNVD